MVQKLESDAIGCRMRPLIAAVVADEKKEEEDVEATGSKRRGADR